MGKWEVRNISEPLITGIFRNNVNFGQTSLSAIVARVKTTISSLIVYLLENESLEKCRFDRSVVETELSLQGPCNHYQNIHYRTGLQSFISILCFLFIFDIEFKAAITDFIGHKGATETSCGHNLHQPLTFVSKYGFRCMPRGQSVMPPNKATSESDIDQSQQSGSVVRS